MKSTIVLFLWFLLSSISLNIGSALCTYSSVGIILTLCEVKEIFNEFKAQRNRLGVSLKTTNNMIFVAVMSINL